MSKKRPLDPTRWAFAPPKAEKDLPDPPGFAFMNERDEASVASKPNASNRGILEKVWTVKMMHHTSSCSNRGI